MVGGNRRYTRFCDSVFVARLRPVGIRVAVDH
jgi:hypothetical protein